MLRPAIPPRRLAVLLAAVLAAHLLLVTTRFMGAPSPGPGSTSAFITRRIDAPLPRAREPSPAGQATVAAATPPQRSAQARPPALRTPRADASPPAPAPAAEAAGAAPAPGAAPSPESTLPAIALPHAAAAMATAVDVAQVTAVAVPAPTRLRYDVTIAARGLSLQGNATFTWRHDGREYDAKLEVGGGVLPSRLQQSTGVLTPQGLAPLRFSDRSRSETATHFDHEKGRLTFSNNRPDALLLAGMQDRLSVVVQLSAMLAAAPARYPPGTAISVPTASTREADHWVFTVEGDEVLQLPGGTVRATKLQRNPRRDYDQKVELWLAPLMDYAPVRLRLTNPNGDSVDQRWAATDRG